jgi:transcriptional regulator with AAA-type ATPase domain
MMTRQMMCPILVGRAHEMQQLQDLLRLSAAGQGQTVLIAGEAGVGKSRLLAELKHTALTSGFQLLQRFYPL